MQAELEVSRSTDVGCTQPAGLTGQPLLDSMPSVGAQTQAGINEADRLTDPYSAIASRSAGPLRFETSRPGKSCNLH